MVRKRKDKVERCIKKLKKKKGINPFAVCKSIFLKVFKTTKNDKHTHEWREQNKFTTYNTGSKSDRHKHRVIRKIAQPLFKGGHKHRIIVGRS